MQKVGGGAIVSLSSTGNLVYIENYTGHDGTNKAAEKQWLDMQIKTNLVNLELE